MGNAEHYRDVEFERWAWRAELSPAEEFLLEEYLDPRRATVEAGTGGGCILLELHRRGHRRLHGFDLVPELIEVARRRDPSGAIDFRVQDAARLDYRDATFDHALYLQQVICFIENAAAREQALREARRVLRPGGTAIFSFLCFEGRTRSPLHAAFAGYLGLVRRMAGAERTIQLQPWLRRRGRFNARALLDAAPHVYWFRVPEAAALLERAGFRIAAAGWESQLAEGRVVTDPAALRARDAATTVYFVCRA